MFQFWALRNHLFFWPSYIKSLIAVWGPSSHRATSKLIHWTLDFRCLSYGLAAPNVEL